MNKQVINNSKRHIGKHYNHITILNILDEKAKNGTYLYLCKCDCGKKFKLPSDKLKIKQSCGCEKIKGLIERSKSHGGTGTRLYYVWAGAKGRCYNPNNEHYELYGGRGIKMCQEWKNNFEVFREWAIQNGYNEKAKFGECMLDRIDTDGNYEPSNCRWVNSKKQQNNRRNNHLLEYKGEVHTLKEWAEITGIDYKALFNRIQRGMSIERALTQPQKHIVYITYKGKRKRLTEWASQLGIPHYVLSNRRKKGWTDEEIIEGRC